MLVPVTVTAELLDKRRIFFMADSLIFKKHPWELKLDFCFGKTKKPCVYSHGSFLKMRLTYPCKMCLLSGGSAVSSNWKLDYSSTVHLLRRTTALNTWKIRHQNQFENAGLICGDRCRLTNKRHMALVIVSPCVYRILIGLRVITDICPKN